MIKKEIFIDGMTCGHCKMRVEKTLNGLNEVENAEVFLDDKKAVVEFNSDVADDKLIELIDDAGYDVIKIQQ